VHQKAFHKQCFFINTLFRSEYLFNFDEAFEIHDDIEVLKRMGLSFGLEKGECGDKSLKVARTMVPKALEPYVSRMCIMFFQSYASIL